MILEFNNFIDPWSSIRPFCRRRLCRHQQTSLILLNSRQILGAEKGAGACRGAAVLQWIRVSKFPASATFALWTSFRQHPCDKQALGGYGLWLWFREKQCDCLLAASHVPSSFGDLFSLSASHRTFWPSPTSWACPWLAAPWCFWCHETKGGCGEGMGQIHHEMRKGHTYKPIDKGDGVVCALEYQGLKELDVC